MALGQLVREGAGVRNIVVIGGEALPDLDPFLLFAEFGGDDPADYVGGFPSHPHRGFETLTYVVEGRLTHTDSRGNSGRLHAGAIQRMKAARGLIHAEMPEQTEGRLKAIQVWLNLPARYKRDDPHYQDVAYERVPVVRRGGTTLRVLVGNVFGTAGAIPGGATDLTFLDVALNAGSELVLPVASGHAAFAYVIEGVPRIAGYLIDAGNGLVLSDGESVRLASDSPSRMLVLAARPIGEPIARAGPFVMNTQQELAEALTDFKSGQFGT
jgi:redox-sensitive bicupin YhaK (pirin superfamily)